MRGPAVSISWTFGSDQPHHTLNGVLIRMLLYCSLLAETTSVSRKKKQKKSLKMASDLTSVCLNLPLIEHVPAHCPVISAFEPFLDHVIRAHRDYVCALRCSYHSSIWSRHLFQDF